MLSAIIRRELQEVDTCSEAEQFLLIVNYISRHKHSLIISKQKCQQKQEKKDLPIIKLLLILKLKYRLFLITFGDFLNKFEYSRHQKNWYIICFIKYKNFKTLLLTQFNEIYTFLQLFSQKVGLQHRYNKKFTIQINHL